MKKYIFIFKSEVMSNLQYIFNIIASFIGYLIMLFILFSLWKYIYSDPSEIINGYTMNQMVWYVILTEILWSIVSGRKLCAKISDDVRSGNIAYNINKPYGYIEYSLFSHLGSSFIKGIIYTLLAMTMGFIFLGVFPHLNILNIIVILITSIFAIIINTLLIISIGLFSFFIEDANPFYWLYSKIILLLGTIFPIEYMPKFLQPILKFSPIYVVSYGPAKLFVDFSWIKSLSIIIAQIIYIAISYGICKLIYKKGVKNLNVNGG